MRIVACWLLAVALAAGEASALGEDHISFRTDDGFVLKMDQYGQGNRDVVLVHGGRFNKESWKKQAEALAGQGFCVFAVDFRGYGQTVAGTETADWGHYSDVLSVVRYLRRSGAKWVALVGASMGGDAAGDAVAQAKPGEIDRLVVLGSSGGDSPGRLNVEKLFVASREEKNSEGLRLPKIKAAFEAAPGPKRLLVLEGSAHAQFTFETGQGPRLMSELSNFLAHGITTEKP